MSGEWSGIMGDVVTGKYQIGLCLWAVTPERHTVLDLNVNFIWESMSTLLALQRPKYDWAFFVRPFTSLSWILILILFCTHFFLIRLMNFIEKNDKK